MVEPVIDVKGLRTQFGTKVIHDNLDFQAMPGEIMGIVGGSGTGKTVFLWQILGLHHPAAGEIRVLGKTLAEWRRSKQTNPATPDIKSRIGMLFQDGALFSSLTVQQNIEVPLKLHTDLSPKLRREICELKLTLAGLPSDAAHKFPSELSGGMRKRASLARALALDPEILFLDEPTAGLDPIGAADFDNLILDLQKALGITVMMITHDLDSLYAITDRISVLINKRVKVGTIQELLKEPDPWIQEYFNGPRGRAAASAKSAQRRRGKTDSAGSAADEPAGG